MIELVRQVLLPRYGIAADAHITPLGHGLINDTLLVRSSECDLVLQKLNTRVFASPGAVVANSSSISRHLLQKRRLGQYRMQVVQPVATQTGELAVDLGGDGFWRAISFLPASRSIERVTCTEEAETAARGFGHFVSALSDIDSASLDVVIDDFHHLPGRVARLELALASDPCNRAGRCMPWIAFALSQQGLLDELAESLPGLPLRVCHNDTKINNILFDAGGAASLAVIDLDTCMPGQLMYDFGDMVRSFCSPEAEDSTELDKVVIRESMFAAICRGYLGELQGVVTPAERASLWLGARLMCFMLAVRFLTDYLDGDEYFHTSREGQNLDRAINQFTLYQSLLTQQGSLKAMLGLD